MGLTGPQSALPPAKNDILIYIKKKERERRIKKKGKKQLKKDVREKGQIY